MGVMIVKLELRRRKHGDEPPKMDLSTPSPRPARFSPLPSVRAGGRGAQAG